MNGVKQFRDDLSWTWLTVGGRSLLVTDGGGQQVILCGAHHAHIQTRDLEHGRIRDIQPSDRVARMIASAPDVRRHAQALIHGIDIGAAVFEHEPDPALDEVLRQLRISLTNSGAN